MKLNRSILALSVLALTAFPAVSAVKAQPLTLQEAEVLAIERNLNLQAQTYATRAAEALVQAGFGIYDPELRADLAVGEARERLNLFFLNQANGFSDTSISEYRRFNFALVQRIPTGGELALEFNNLYGDDTPDTLIDPYYDSAARLSLIQPLLRGFGRTITEQDILFAAHDRNVAVQELRQQAFNVLAAVRFAWFDALRFRDLVDFRRTSIQLAEQVLKENRARVDAGVLPPVEILEAQVGVQLRERELLDSERAYQDALDRLALQLNLPEPVEIAAEALEAPPVEVGIEEGVRAAFAQRPDLLQRLEEVERLALARKVARNNTLPQLDLAARYGQSGLGETYGDTLDDVTGTEFRSWEVGVIFSYPLGNTTAENQLRRARYLLTSQQALLAQLRDEIRQEVRSAIRDLEVNRKKIEVAELATRLARERLQTLIKRKEVGLATTRDVLEGEEDLAEARTEHIAALADYNQALTAYLRATGSLLDRAGVSVTGDFVPRSERPIVQPE